MQPGQQSGICTVTQQRRLPPGSTGPAQPPAAGSFRATVEVGTTCLLLPRTQRASRSASLPIAAASSGSEGAGVDYAGAGQHGGALQTAACPGPGRGNSGSTRHAACPPLRGAVARCCWGPLCVALFTFARAA